MKSKSRVERQEWRRKDEAKERIAREDDARGAKRRRAGRDATWRARYIIRERDAARDVANPLRRDIPMTV